MEFAWGEDEKEAWQKKELLNAPILAYPDHTKIFILNTDASSYGIGAVLSQTQDGREKVFAYGSRKMTKVKR